jgi:hypothetical protein
MIISIFFFLRAGRGIRGCMSPCLTTDLAALLNSASDRKPVLSETPTFAAVSRATGPNALDYPAAGAEIFEKALICS